LSGRIDALVVRIGSIPRRLPCAVVEPSPIQHYLTQS
jgi:hypothetical protein